MEAGGYIHFHAPEQNIHGSWFIRSVDQDAVGYYRYLAYDEASRPFIASFLTPTANILYDTFVRALEEYDYYYAYHGGLKASSTVPPKIVESEVMDF